MYQTHKDLVGVKGGKKRPPEYNSWGSMKRRCLNQNSEVYARYGGRGISVCPRWDDYGNFVEDMGRRPGPGYSIDRIDNDGDYEPSNCRWATRQEQARNNSQNRLLTYDGRTMSASTWAEALGINPGTLRRRVQRGWTDEQALTVKKGKHHEKRVYKGRKGVNPLVLVS